MGSLINSMKAANKPFSEMLNMDSVNEIAEILHKCYEEWIKEAGSMRGKRKYDTLEKIYYVFHQFINYSPQNVWLLMAAEKNKAYFQEYKDEVESILQAIEAEKDKVSKPELEVNHFCNGMPLNVAIEHFRVFTTKKSKNNEIFLTDKQFDFFIEKAFRNKMPIEKQVFSRMNGEKGLIVRRFYEFYEIAANEYEPSSQCKEKYVRLLTENFNGWDYENVFKNFNKKPVKGW